MLKLIQTCIACPEQYDVVDDTTNEVIGYIRYRWGHLVCNPVENGEYKFDKVLYEWYPKDSDGFEGVLEEEEREIVLSACLDALEKYYNLN